MTVAFLVLLAAAWMAVFLPAVLRARKTSAMSTSERWRRRMQLITPRRLEARRSGRWVVVPEARGDLARASFRNGQRRRKRILQLMIGACVGSLVASLAIKGAWAVQIGCDVSLGAYCLLLVEARRRRHERARKVRSLARRRRRRAGGSESAAWLEPARAVGQRR